MGKPFTIWIPTRPQPDTLAAIFLLKTYGNEKFPGIQDAKVEVQPMLPSGETFDSLLEKNILALDLGGSALDHHGKSFCTSELVAQYLNIEKDPSVARLLQYAKRDDAEGKGTLSSDPIDRAFGLSGLISSLNKAHPSDPQKIVDTVMPLLEAHYLSAREHHFELPQEVEKKKSTGQYSEQTLKQGGKTLKVSFVVSDKPSMPTYLRSFAGPHADVVLQKSEKTNNFCILTRQERMIDLSKVAALIRMREAELSKLSLSDDESYLTMTGRIKELPHWYFDPATNSILNGGAHANGVAESLIPWEELQKIVRVGLEIGGKRK